MKSSARLPKVTVMMPALNVEKYIGAAIESVLRQNWRDFELIILDDCSTDKTHDVASRYLSDARVRLFRNRRKMCDADNRNLILRLAQGKYIAPHDADDIMLQGRLRKQAEFLESHPEAGVVFGNAVVADETATKGRQIIQPLRASGGCLRRAGFVKKLDYNFTHCASMARKEIILKAGGYEQSLILGTDSRLYRRLLKQTRFYYLNHLCFIYRRRPKSHFHGYFTKRCLGMNAYFCSSPQNIPRGRMLVDRFFIDLRRMAPALRKTLAWRLSYYCEKMNWNKKQEKAKSLSLPSKITSRSGGLNDAEKYREAFLKPFAEALAKKNECLLEGGLVSSEDAGIFLIGPKNRPNGEWILSFIQAGYYFHAANNFILYKKNNFIAARGFLEPLIFSERPKPADGSPLPPLFWNPWLRQYCLNVDIYRTFGVRSVCVLKSLVKIEIDNALKKAVRKQLTFVERYEIFEQRSLADKQASMIWRSNLLEKAARQTTGVTIRLPEMGLIHLPQNAR